MTTTFSIILNTISFNGHTKKRNLTSKITIQANILKDLTLGLYIKSEISDF